MASRNWEDFIKLDSEARQGEAVSWVPTYLDLISGDIFTYFVITASDVFDEFLFSFNSWLDWALTCQDGGPVVDNTGGRDESHGNEGSDEDYQQTPKSSSTSASRKRGGGGGDGHGGKKRRGQKLQPSDWVERRYFACPFLKHNPYGANRERCFKAWAPGNFHEVKQHLSRCHGPTDWNCWLCAHTSEGVDELMQHILTPHVVDSSVYEASLHTLQHEDADGRYDKTTAARISVRAKSRDSDENKWTDLYKILFPNVARNNIPSPYWDDALRTATFGRRQAASSGAAETIEPQLVQRPSSAGGVGFPLPTPHLYSASVSTEPKTFGTADLNCLDPGGHLSPGLVASQLAELQSSDQHRLAQQTDSAWLNESSTAWDLDTSHGFGDPQGPSANSSNCHATEPSFWDAGYMSHLASVTDSTDYNTSLMGNNDDAGREKDLAS
ncbi:hypothetical protein BR93DRAFT_966600 [Coniochaeta sp. PMI_546]|nr:hypothetical protein BR93DRAFT_966600 [Coniochaeta sp. PMI_546]